MLELYWDNGKHGSYYLAIRIRVLGFGFMAWDYGLWFRAVFFVVKPGVIGFSS